jgi:hypothetical protein
MITDNRQGGEHRGAIKHGDALLAGILRCRRCGRKLTLRYTGSSHDILRYSCSRGWMDNGEPRCIAFGGLRVDDAIAAEVLRVVEPAAVEAARQAQRQELKDRDDVRDPLARDLEAKRLLPIAPSGDMTPRIHKTVSSLPSWNFAGTRRSNESLICSTRLMTTIVNEPFRHQLCSDDFTSLTGDQPTVWADPTTDARLKKRIVRTLINEVIADIEPQASEIVLVLHWAGGVHTELRLPRRRRGQRNSTAVEIIEAVRTLVRIADDAFIAGLLNRNKLTTGHGNRWTRERVTALRSHHKISIYSRQARDSEGWMTLTQAAKALSITAKTLRLAAERGEIVAQHPLSDGPWLFNRTAVETPAAYAIAQRSKRNSHTPAGHDSRQQNLSFSMT